jgi:hypothetical protein
LEELFNAGHWHKKGEKMKDQQGKIAAPTTESTKEEKIWGGFIIDILKKWLGFNQLTYGIKKKF